MGTPVEDRIVACLEWGHYGQSFGGTTHRHECRRVSESTYEVIDFELGIRVHLPVSKVMDPRFDVVLWFAQQIQRIIFDLVAEPEREKFWDD